MAGIKVNRDEAFPAEEVCRRIYESHAEELGDHPRCTWDASLRIW